MSVKSNKVGAEQTRLKCGVDQFYGDCKYATRDGEKWMVSRIRVLDFPKAANF